MHLPKKADQVEVLKEEDNLSLLKKVSYIKSTMQWFLPIFLIGFLIGCQTENSSSNDAGIYGGTGSAQFLAAKTILTSCNACHAYASMSEADLRSATTNYPGSSTPSGLNLVVAGDAEGSPLYYRLTNSTGANGPKTMPSGAPLGNSDLDVIKTWINSLQ